MSRFLGMKGKVELLKILVSSNAREKISNFQSIKRRIEYCEDSEILLEILTECLNRPLDSLFNSIIEFLLLEISRGNVSAEKVFVKFIPFIKMKQFQPFLFAILKKVPSSEIPGVISQYQDDIYGILPPEIKRLIWISDISLFRKEFFKILKEYSLGDAQFRNRHTVPKIFALIGSAGTLQQTNFELYNHIHFFLRKLYQNTTMMLYCQFKVDLLRSTKFPKEFKQADVNFVFHHKLSLLFQSIVSDGKTGADVLDTVFELFKELKFYFEFFITNERILTDFKMILAPYINILVDFAFEVLSASVDPNTPCFELSEVINEITIDIDKDYMIPDLWTHTSKKITSSSTSKDPQQVQIEKNIKSKIGVHVTKFQLIKRSASKLRITRYLSKTSRCAPPSFKSVCKVIFFLMRLYYFRNDIGSQFLDNHVHIKLFQLIVNSQTTTRQESLLRDSNVKLFLAKNPFYQALIVKIMNYFLTKRQIHKFLVTYDHVRDLNLYFTFIPVYMTSGIENDSNNKDVERKLHESNLSVLNSMICGIMQNDIHTDFFPAFENKFIREDVIKRGYLQMINIENEGNGKNKGRKTSVYVRHFVELMTKYFKISFLNEDIEKFINGVMNNVQKINPGVYKELEKKKNATNVKNIVV